MAEMTNGDCIRVMSDEQLATIIARMCPPGKYYCRSSGVPPCDDCWLKWLRGPAAEGKGMTSHAPTVWTGTEKKILRPAASE